MEILIGWVIYIAVNLVAVALTLGLPEKYGQSRRTYTGEFLVIALFGIWIVAIGMLLLSIYQYGRLMHWLKAPVGS